MGTGKRLTADLLQGKIKLLKEAPDQKQGQKADAAIENVQKAWNQLTAACYDAMDIIENIEDKAQRDQLGKRYDEKINKIAANVKKLVI